MENDLTPEEQAQFLEEAATLAGKNVTSAEEEELDIDNSDEEDIEETETQEEEEKPKSKTEEKIKKLLAQKNQEKKKAETLAEKVERLEQANARAEFYSEYPEAKSYAEKIDDFIQEKPWFTREDALFYLQGKWEIQIWTSKSWFVGRPASKTENKDITKSSTEDMEKYLKDNFNSLPL